MKIISKSFLLFYALILSGCQNIETPILTATPTTKFGAIPPSTPYITSSPVPKFTETPWPTLWFGYDRSQYFIGTPPTPKPTITAPPTRYPPIILPGNLEIEEYSIKAEDAGTEVESPFLERHPESGGVYILPNGGIIAGKIFQAQEVDIGYAYPEIHATLGDKEIFMVKCGAAMPIRSVITAWVYGRHWIIQGYCNKKFDIFWDGISLNQSRKYQESFAFQLLGGKPFYLFKRDEKVWLYYSEKETLLGYDEVKLNYCCMNYPPPEHYENLIAFYATKGNQLYYVVIGLFK